MRNMMLMIVAAGLAAMDFEAAGQTALRRTNTLGLAATKLATVKVNPAAAHSLPTVAKTTLASPGVKPTDLGRLKVFVREGPAWKNVETPTDGNTITPRVPANVQALIATPVTNRMVLKQGSMHLRFATPAPPNSPEPYDTFELESYTAPNPARWDAQKSMFQTELRVALFRTNHISRQPPAAAIIFDFAGYQAEVTPSQLTFTTVGSFQTLQVTFPRNDVEARIDVFPLTEEAPLVVPARWLKCITNTVSPRSILGFGLGTATVTFKRLDQNGKELDEGPDLTLDVAPQFSRVNPTLVITRGNGRANFEVRSVGTKTEQITASAGDLSTVATVQARAPWLYLVAVLAGGITGGCARILNARRRKKGTMLKFLLEGCVAGLLASAAVSAGVALSLLPAAVTGTELGIFLISAAVGMVGVAAIQGLKKLIPQFFR